MRNSSRLWGCGVVVGWGCLYYPIALRAWGVVERGRDLSFHRLSVSSFVSVVSFSASGHKVFMLSLFHLC